MIYLENKKYSMSIISFRLNHVVISICPHVWFNSKSGILYLLIALAILSA